MGTVGRYRVFLHGGETLFFVDYPVKLCYFTKL